MGCFLCIIGQLSQNTDSTHNKYLDNKQFKKWFVILLIQNYLYYFCEILKFEIYALTHVIASKSKRLAGICSVKLCLLSNLISKGRNYLYKYLYIYYLYVENKQMRRLFLLTKSNLIFVTFKFEVKKKSRYFRFEFSRSF